MKDSHEPEKNMARQATKFKARNTPSETLAINNKYLGKEPPEQDETDSCIVRAQFWYHNQRSSKDARDYARSYFLDQNDQESARLISKVSDDMLPLSYCWLVDLEQSYGWSFDFLIKKRIHEKLYDSLKYAIDKKESSDEPEKPTVADRTNEKIRDVISDIEDKIDQVDLNFSMYDYLVSNEIPQRYISRIREYYEPLLAEFSELQKTKDKDLLEAYSYLSKKDIKDRYIWLTGIIADLDKWSDNQKKQRAPRRKKVIPATKKVAKLTYKESDSEYKVQSANPAKIIGAKELWLFNTNSKVLSRIVAIEPGLDLRGQTLFNFDPEKSVEKRVGRKTEQMLNSVQTATKPQLRKILDTVNGKALEPTGRINKHTVLLRIV